MCRTPAQRKDAHVVATAVKAKASTIVTYNIKDFTPAVIQHYGLAKIRPDVPTGRQRYWLGCGNIGTA